jgi:hypothetical protein
MDTLKMWSPRRNHVLEQRRAKRPHNEGLYKQKRKKENNLITTIIQEDKEITNKTMKHKYKIIHERH